MTTLQRNMTRDDIQARGWVDADGKRQRTLQNNGAGRIYVDLGSYRTCADGTWWPLSRELR